VKLKLLIAFSLFGWAFQLADSQLWNPPEHFPAPSYAFENNPLAAEKIALGRALFYDPILSEDGTISCASCHSPYNAFAHTDHDLSHGINDEMGKRNAPALFNLAWSTSFSWDGAVNHLDMQALAPISDSLEMRSNINEAIARMQQSKLYRQWYFEAFGDCTITGEHTLKALAQFELTLVSATSKYDKVKAGLAEFTAQESQGYALFQQHCGSCHTEPLFTNGGFANNGLPIDTFLNDQGKATVTGYEKDEGLFKIPSLRNLSYTFPYMHDGRFQKLNEVLEHYTSGIAQTPNLNASLEESIVLTPNQKVDIIAFLRTLNDPDFVFDPNNKFPRELLLTQEQP